MAYLISNSKKHKLEDSLQKHEEKIQVVRALIQDIEAFADQMQQEKGISSRKLTREQSNFVFNILKKALNNVKGFTSKRLNKEIIEVKPKAEEVKILQPQGQTKESEKNTKTFNEKLNLNKNGKISEKAESSEKKVNIGFVDKMKSTLTNKKLSKGYAKLLKKERKKAKGLQQKTKSI